MIALTARRAGILSGTGSGAAVGVGMAATAAGWSWAVLLVAYFATSVALTRYRAAAKATRTGAVVAKGGARDALQVIANGGVFALSALLWSTTGWDGWRAAGVGAIAAAASDTWATEIGTLARQPPWSIMGWRKVPAGTSGAVSPIGLAAALAGAGFIAAIAFALGWPPSAVAAAVVGGVGGSTIDSLLGATVQQRRWCDCCGAPTERLIHSCGTTTGIVGGLRWMDNDVVNALSTVAGGLLGLVASA